MSVFSVTNHLREYEARDELWETCTHSIYLQESTHVKACILWKLLSSRVGPLWASSQLLPQPRGPKSSQSNCLKSTRQYRKRASSSELTSRLKLNPNRFLALRRADLGTLQALGSPNFCPGIPLSSCKQTQPECLRQLPVPMTLPLQPGSLSPQSSSGCLLL